jgi:hypothetical protein
METKGYKKREERRKANGCHVCKARKQVARLRAKKARLQTAAYYEGIATGKVYPLFDSDPITGIHYRMDQYA